MDSVAELDQAITGEFETFSRPGLRIHGRSLRYLGFQFIARRRAASKTSPAPGSWCAHIDRSGGCRNPAEVSAMGSTASHPLRAVIGTSGLRRQGLPHSRRPALSQVILWRVYDHRTTADNGSEG